MSQILPKNLADKLAFRFNPKPLETNVSRAAERFVEQQAEHNNGFAISSIVSEQAGIEELRKRNIEIQVEETVLERMKEIQEAAYSEAHALGIKEGTDKAFAEQQLVLQEKLTRFDAVLEQLDSVRSLILKENEVAFMKVLFAIAEKLAMRSIQMEKEPILKCLASVIESVQKEENIIINLSEVDMAFIEELRERKVKEVVPLSHVKLNAVPEMIQGEFIVESNHGMIDASIKTRVEKVWEAVSAKFPILRNHKVDLPGNEIGKDEVKDDGSSDSDG